MASTDETSTPTFELTRRLRAPIERVWASWSQAEALGRWWGPAGCTLEVKRFEFQPGGFFHYAMNFPGVPAMYGRFNYREIAPRGRIVWLNSFATDNGGIARAPFAELCPLEIENTVTFTPEGDGVAMNLRARPFGASAAELQFFKDLQSSLEQGYGGTMAQLDAFLASS